MEKKVTVKIFNNSNNELPEYESEFAAGLDLRADFSNVDSTLDFNGNDRYYFNNLSKELTIFANGGRVLIPTNLHVAIPEGYELQIRPRSGLALKHGISIVNSPGTIDSDYRGSIGIILINTDPHHDFSITHGDRIAQAILNKFNQIKWERVDSINELGDTVRGEGGFGHTGK